MNRSATTETQSGGYGKLLADRGFQSFLWTQALGAFNDNVYKMIVSVMAVRIAAGSESGGAYLALAGAVFVLPFLLFAGPAGQIADRFSKTRVLQVTKLFEVAIMALGIGALISARIEPLLGVLFLLAMQATFFSPAKYSILPEMVGEAQISRANGLLELSTFMALVLGSSFGTLLYSHWQHAPVNMGLVLLALAVAGSLASLGIPKTLGGQSSEPFHWNPVYEVRAGAVSLLRNKPLLWTVFGISWFWFAGALFQMALVLAGKETLHVSETQVGLLVTALALGIGAGSIAAGRISGDRIDLGLVPVGSALMAIFTIALGVTNSYAYALVWLAAIGFSAGLFAVPLNAYLQEKADASERGRILSTNNFANMIGVIMASGVLWLAHDVLGRNAGQIILGLGVAMAVGTLYAIWLVRGAALRLVVRQLARVVFRIRIEGAHHIPLKGGALIVANHVSFADAVLLSCATPRAIRFLMWQPYFEMRGLKPFFRVLHAIPLSQDAPKAALRSLRAAREELKNGRLVGIFPEGALTQTGHVQTFQRGFERIVDGVNAPVIPVYIDGMYGHPLSMKGGAPFRSWSRIWRRMVVIRVGEPIHGPVSAPELRQRVVNLATDTAVLRKTRSATLAHRFIASARRNWSSPAIADSTGTRLTFGKALIGAILVRRWLDAHRPGERSVGMMLPSSSAGALVNLGVTLAGRTAVNLNFTAGSDNLSVAISRSGLSTIVTSRKFLEKTRIEALPGMVFVEDLTAGFSAPGKIAAALTARLAPARWLARRCQPDDVAAIIFSSGSTGDPKGAQLTHWNVLSNIDAAAEVFDAGKRDSMLGALPFFHCFGYTYTLWFPMVQEFSAVFHPNPLDGRTIGELAAEHRSTFLLSTPTFCTAYLRQCKREQFLSLRYVILGAEKLRPALAQSFQEKFGVLPVEGYGCTEMAPVIAVNSNGVVSDARQQGQRPGSVGRPLPGVSLRVVHPETLEAVEHGEQGLLLVNGPSRMLGYLDDAERTKAALHEGWYITGDLARIDDDGFLHIIDRLARTSKIGGEMVPHLKVEEVLSGVLRNSPCLVVGIPDDTRGERLAVLYTLDDVSPSQLAEQLGSAGLPALWIPKRENFYHVDSIPMLGTGKTDLRRAKAMAQECAAARTTPRR